MPILSLDVGTKKIGVAYSEYGLLADEFCTINYTSQLQAITEILFLIKNKKVDKLIIGLPCYASGTDSNQTNHVRDFSKKLEEKIKSSKIDAQILFEDEELTTKEAERILFSQGKSLEVVRERRDQLAAKLILDQYLNR
ncbi:MAG: hypothetical protein ACD_58C00294G0002 [uncultured bacterium]|nr:MAG: hypothetical protein ACD_58C00294G0002 [uncultured bacterium]